MALPKLDAGAALVLMLALAWRETAGAQFCKSNVVGPLRMLARSPPVSLDMAGTMSIAPVMMECREALALHCRVCNGCSWKDEPP